MFSLSPAAPAGRARRLAATALLGALVLAGCANREQPADPDAGSPRQAEQDFPVELSTPDGREVVLEHRPERIVSLSASHTETLFAVGAGDQVIAADEQSNYPPEAPRTKLSGLTPNTEAIIDYDPDLVVVSDDVDGLVDAMAVVDRPVLVLPAAETLDDLYNEISLIGKATGHSDEADDLVRQMRAEIDKIVADTPRPAQSLTYYHELDTDRYSVTSETFIGQVYSLFGLTNIADEADSDAGGYPQLSDEHILQSNPDLIFLADTKCCGQSAETVAKRPGWDTLDAVRDGNVVELDDDIASRWAPRIVDLVRAVADAVAKVSASSGSGQGG